MLNNKDFFFIFGSITFWKNEIFISNVLVIFHPALTLYDKISFIVYRTSNNCLLKFICRAPRCNFRKIGHLCSIIIKKMNDPITSQGKPRKNFAEHLNGWRHLLRGNLHVSKAVIVRDTARNHFKGITYMKMGKLLLITMVLQMIWAHVVDKNLNSIPILKS